MTRRQQEREVQTVRLRLIGICVLLLAVIVLFVWDVTRHTGTAAQDDGWAANAQCVVDLLHVSNDAYRIANYCMMYCQVNYSHDFTGGPCFENCYGHAPVDQDLDNTILAIGNGSKRTR